MKNPCLLYRQHYFVELVELHRHNSIEPRQIQFREFVLGSRLFHLMFHGAKLQGCPG